MYRLLKYLTELQVKTLVAAMETVANASKDESRKDARQVIEIVFKNGHPTHINITIGTRLDK